MKRAATILITLRSTDCSALISLINSTIKTFLASSTQLLSLTIIHLQCWKDMADPPWMDPASNPSILMYWCKKERRIIWTSKMGQALSREETITFLITVANTQLPPVQSHPAITKTTLEMGTNKTVRNVCQWLILANKCQVYMQQ